MKIRKHSYPSYNIAKYYHIQILPRQLSRLFKNKQNFMSYLRPMERKEKKVGDLGFLRIPE